MALQKCKMCGKLIGETPSGYCENCKTLAPEFSNLHKVKDYLYEFPNSNIQTVSIDTGVSVTEICKYIRDGAIVEVSGFSAVADNTCSCGKPLKGNERMCADCKRENEKATDRIKKALTKKVAESAERAPAASERSAFFTQTKR